METKQALRKLVARRKGCETAESLQRLSASVMARLEAHPAFLAAETVLLYRSLPDEVDTHALIDRWAERKRLLLPVVKGEALELRLYRPGEALLKGRFGIEEPAGAAFTRFASIALAVVPGVAFDRGCHRLGRGKGYYDRLLPQLSAAYKIGVCFPFQLLDEVPTEPFDMPMDEVITASRGFPVL